VRMKRDELTEHLVGDDVIFENYDIASIGMERNNVQKHSRL